jgi:RNA polymerase subunit RPABC4/transcription elongation factor Spt4
MKRFVRELRIIPGIAWLVGVLVYLGFTAFAAFMMRADPELRTWPWWGQALFIGLMPAVFIPYAALVGYVNADARRRGMRYIVWTLLAIFIPNGLGIILYFVLRDPLMSPCPHCATLVKHGFAFCPKCGAGVASVCPQCRRAVEPDWSHCTACGTALSREQLPKSVV